MLKILPLLICLAVILGCSWSFGSNGTGNTTNNASPVSKTNTPAAPFNTPDAAPSQNKLVGTWVGRNSNNTGDLKMVFTNDEWTLYADGKMIAAPLKYVVTDDKTIEVTGRDGAKFPLKCSVTGNTLNTDMGGTKVTLKKAP